MNFIYNVIRDFSPNSWLSEFKSNSLKHIAILGLFYYGIAIPLANLGNVVPEIPFQRSSIIEIPHDVFNTAVFPPSYEETLFFGLPHYLSGNPIITLIFASSWSIMHLFAPIFGSSYYLSVDHFLPTIPILFFGLRTWKTGKGWCSILAHGISNLLSTVRGCTEYVTPCPAFFDIKFDSPIFYVIALFSILLLTITYYFFKRNQKSKTKPYV